MLKSEFDEYFTTDSISRKNEIGYKIEDAIHERLEALFKRAGEELVNYWFVDAPEGDVGEPFPDDLAYGHVLFEEMDPSSYDVFGPGYSDFKTEWIYTPVEEVVKEVQESIDKEVTRKAAAKAKRAERKAAKNALRKQAMLKLTPEERKALGFTERKIELILDK